MASTMVAIRSPGASVPASRGAGGPRRDPATAGDPVLRFLRGQAIANAGAALLLRPFAEGEFGRGAAGPSKAHLAEVNAMLVRMGRLTGENGGRMQKAIEAYARSPGSETAGEALRLKQEGGALVSSIEHIRQFYWEIFGQRQTRIAPQLLAADRIALDSYQYVYGGLGRARSIPSPAPFSYMESGTGPATFRRGVAMRKLLSLPNPFPLVKLPYSRLVTPWTLGAIPHEIGHNLQSDLGLWLVVPKLLDSRLASAGIPADDRRIWVQWTKETFADLIGVLLIGPAFVESTMDVVGKGAGSTGAFNPRGVHPTPFLRVRIGTHLLGKMGFADEARRIDEVWSRLYPDSVGDSIPASFRKNFGRALPVVVDSIVATPFTQLGGKTLRQVICFRRQDQEVATEAAARLASGRDPGIIPERFLINAARIAFDRGLAPPGLITRHFYDALGRR
ncbi:MAG TPA: hypothetical protein VF548_04355 [Allosphingosinicella sp.]